MIVTHPHRRHVEAAAFVIKAPEKGACGPVTKSGDLEMIDRALAGPVHPGQSAGQISQWPILHRRSILRAASTQGNATALRRDGENLAAISQRSRPAIRRRRILFQATKLKLCPTLVKFPIE
jgi:hypothetical protein